MAAKKRAGHRLDADYTEEVVGFALESFLTLMAFPRQRFSVEPFSRAKERWLGADARLNSAIRGFRPFYMQFKRPSAYPDYSNSKIIRDRVEFGMTVGPRTLFFPLRRKQDAHRDFQHNVLYRLREKLLSRGIGDAAYVCPLFLDRSAYRQNLHWSGLSRWLRFRWRYPWDLEEVLVNDSGGSIHFDRLPVLSEHITVPPHAKVTSPRHRYSFTENGTELCFHSPLALPDNASSLAKFLYAVAEGFLDRGEKLRPQESDDFLRDLIEGVYDGTSLDLPKAVFDTPDPVGRWFAWGSHLREHYGIEQYALVRWNERALEGFL